MFPSQWETPYVSTFQKPSFDLLETAPQKNNNNNKQTKKQKQQQQQKI